MACAVSLLSTSALATNFVTVIDPVTGRPTIAVISSGTGENPASRPSDQQIIVPAQVINVSGPQPPVSPGVETINVDDFVGAASPEIIQALIKNSSDIQRENQALISNLSSTPPPSPAPDQSDLDRVAKTLDNLIGGIAQQISKRKADAPPAAASGTPDSGSQPNPAIQLKNSALLGAIKAAEERRDLANRMAPGSGGESGQPDTLQPSAPADNRVVAEVLIQQISNNVLEQTRPMQQALHNAINTPPAAGGPAQNPELNAAQQNAIDALNDLTQAATNVAIQAALQNPKRPALDSGGPIGGIDPAAGVDPAAESRRQAEQRKQQQAQQKEERKQEVTNNNAQLIAQIQEAARQLQEQNRQAQEEKKKQAEEQYLQQLSQAERERLEQAKSQQQERPSPPPQSPQNRNPAPAAPEGVSVIERLRQSLGQLQDQNSEQTKQPAGNERPSRDNTPSNAEELKTAMARLTAMLAQLNQHMDKQPGVNDTSDENSQLLTQQLAQLMDLYTGLIQQAGNPSLPPQNSPQIPVTLASLTQELVAKTYEQTQESLRQLDESLKSAVSNLNDPWASYIYVARQEYTTHIPATGLHGGAIAHYEGKVHGTVGDDAINGILRMQVDLTPSSNEITGSMNFGSHGTLHMRAYDGIGDRGSLAGWLQTDDNKFFGGNVEGGFEGNLFGPNAEQVGGTWDVTVYKNDSRLDGGGKFVGAQVPPPPSH